MPSLWFMGLFPVATVIIPVATSPITAAFDSSTALHLIPRSPAGPVPQPFPGRGPRVLLRTR